MTSPKIFITYSWAQEALVDEIEEKFQAIGITLTRDKREIKFKDSIKEFMKKIKDSDYIFMVISDAYLKSENCMYEVLELTELKDYKKRIIPLVYHDSLDIFHSRKRIKYIKYWQDENKKINEEISPVKHSYFPESLRDELKKIENICQNIGEFCGVISDMNTIVVNKDEKGNEKVDYKTIFEYLNFDGRELDGRLILILDIEDEEEQDNAIDDFIDDYSKDPRGYFFKAYIFSKEPCIVIPNQ